MSNRSRTDKCSPQTADNFELDTPYFRRSLAQKHDANLELIELRIDEFLSEKGIVHMQVDQHTDVHSIAKNLNLLYMNKRTSISELPDDSRKSSMSSFNLETNSLFLRRKASVNQPPTFGLGLAGTNLFSHTN